MRSLRLLIPAIALLFLSGCFQIIDVMRINPDGSGTVEQSVLISKKFIGQMNEMMGGFSGYSSAKAEPPELFDPAMLREQASTMGEGVVYQSGKKVETADFTGFTAVYAFSDINSLKLDQLNLNQQIPVTGAPAGDGQPARMLSFHFTKGSPATLIIEQPVASKPAAAPPGPDGPATAAPVPQGAASDEEAAKLAKMFMGMKVLLAIDINGSIVSTNATYRDGNRLTLLELDMEKLGNSFSRMEKLTGIKTGSLGEAKELLKEIPGVRMDANDKLTVVFDK
ncbi:MAG TPA: hypothetical protein VI298_02340 [Geobacteraceae bacterium]